MVDAVVGVLLDKLLTFLASEGQQLFELDHQFTRMKNELSFMQSYLEEADKMKGKDGRETLKTMTRSLRELVYDVEDVIADCQILFMKQHEGCLSNFMSYCSPQLLKFRHKISKRLKVTNQGIEDAVKRMGSYLLVAPTTLREREEHSKTQPLIYPTLTEETDMVGLKDHSAKIEEWVSEARGYETVIGIVGMGGIGKTTLAQQICSSVNVKYSFDSTIIVTVSQNYEFEDLLKKMLIKMNVAEASLKKNAIDDLLEKIKRELEKKKYLLVLDDVWETDKRLWWSSLKSAFPKRNGGCVIVTTRKLGVARSMGATDKHIHHCKTLSDDDSWSLFAKVAFAWNGGTCPNPDLDRFGKEIVARCGGLPLVIKVVGGMMLGKRDSVHDWMRISEHLRDELAEEEEGEKIMSSLELSYEELPAYLKPCFLCLSMFPEDYLIVVNDIVHWWVGEGFVLGSKGRTASEIGNECVVELINRCLLIGEKKDAFEREFVRVRIHDIVRDMVIKIAREENFINLDESGRPEFSIQSRRLGIFSDGVIDRMESTEVKKSKIEIKLRTLWGLHVGKEVVSSENMELCKLKRLRVLHVSFGMYLEDQKVMVKDWFDAIVSLPLLVSLTIKKCRLEELPNSIKNLHNLQTLHLHDWSNLKMLPPSITKLYKLTSFEIIGCGSLECMPDGIGKLSKLERFVLFRPTIPSHKNASQICQLKSLGQLRELCMELKNTKQWKEGDLNVLSVLQHLRVLVIIFADNDVSKLNHQLSPLQHLKVLALVQYPGECTPVWLNPTTFPNLQFLGLTNTLIGGSDLKHMNPKFWGNEGEIWKIEGLLLGFLYNLEERWEMFHKALPYLRMVRVSYCPKLKSFPLEVTEYDEIWWK